MKERKQRGSAWSIAIVLFLYRFLGYKFIYYLQYPISFFYFIMASNVKDALRIYYKQIDIPFTKRVYYEHLRIFAVCLVDRFISKIEPNAYTFDYEDISVPLETLSSASILIYSHFGGWAASSNGIHVNNQINIVMQESMLDGIKKLEEAIESKNRLNVIDLNQGTLQVSIAIANALIEDEVVAMMADRASNQKASIACTFFGKEAFFNKSPFQVAYKTDKPILVYFIILVGMQKYKVEYLKIEMDKSKNEEEAIVEAMAKYIKKFEIVIRQYPNQWFNLYDFWETK